MLSHALVRLEELQRMDISFLKVEPGFAALLVRYIRRYQSFFNFVPIIFGQLLLHIVMVIWLSFNIPFWVRL
jgi:hypothetical protein